ncbi:hypothetical protein IPL68_04055 [Candidatus Saccharibacteria bacterium]|nr:MAG: hypothetical protein IPL68_04055 [Candidatus Saccharibacteria bacterium]
MAPILASKQYNGGMMYADLETHHAIEAQLRSVFQVKDVKMSHLSVSWARARRPSHKHLLALS